MVVAEAARRAARARSGQTAAVAATRAAPTAIRVICQPGQGFAGLLRQVRAEALLTQQELARRARRWPSGGLSNGHYGEPYSFSHSFSC